MERNAMLVCQHIVFEIWPKHRLKIYTKELFPFLQQFFFYGTRHDLLMLTSHHELSYECSTIRYV